MTRLDNHKTQGDDGAGRHDPFVRVVLVGRSDVERTLRRMGEIELIRASEPLSAIGEVAHPIDPECPSQTVVLVAPGAVATERAAAFSAGIRRADPKARILALGDADATSFDGLLSHLDGDAANLLSQLAGLPEQADGRRVPNVETDIADTAEQTTSAESQPLLSTVHDDSILNAMLKGSDAVEAAMTGVRSRLGIPNAAFVAAARVGPEGKPPTGGVAVKHGERTLGYLVAPRADRALVESEAAALAPWIALIAQQDQLKRAAFMDELTGAWNRRYFTKFLGAAIDKARSARHSVTVLYFDLDNFKIYNDRYGHAAGDEILVETVKLLRSVIRPSDRVCRIGGDEFAVIFYDPEGPRDPGRPQSPSDIGPIARRFQQQICTHKFPKLGDEAPGTLTISGGMAAFPWDGADVETLLDRADQLALQSKRMGKNAITLGPGAERVCRINDDTADLPIDD